MASVSMVMHALFFLYNPKPLFYRIGATDGLYQPLGARSDGNRVVVSARHPALFCTGLRACHKPTRHVSPQFVSLRSD